MESNVVQHIPISSNGSNFKKFKQAGNDNGNFNLILKENIKAEDEKGQENSLVVALNVLIANILNIENGINSKLTSKDIELTSDLLEKLSTLAGLDKATVEKLLSSLSNNKNKEIVLKDLLSAGENFKDEILKKNIDIHNIESSSLEDKLLDKILLKNKNTLEEAKHLLSNIDEDKEVNHLKNLNFSDEIKSPFLKDNTISNITVTNNKLLVDSNQPVINMNSGTKVNDFIEIIEFIKNGESKKMTVKLEPDFLGKMNIHLTENAGKINAKIFVEQEVVKHYLVANLDSIKQQLNDKGIVIDNMDFMFMGYDQNQQEFKEAKNQNNNQFKTGIKINQDEIIEKDRSVSGIYA